jgi:hypothetical protein
MLVIIVDYQNKLVTKNQSTPPYLKLHHTKQKLYITVIYRVY